MKFDKTHSPETLDDVIFADAVVQQTLHEYANGQRDKHLLLYGPRGSGKSVSAQLVLNSLMGVIVESGLAVPLHAQSFGAKHSTFDPALNIWSMQMSLGAHQGCVIFDELDQLILPMQHKLREFMDQYECGFIIGTTNNLHLVDGPLKDRFRCLCVEYPQTQQWIPRVVQVMKAENIPLTQQQAAILLANFEGSGRKLNEWLEDYVLRIKASAASMVANMSSAPASTTVFASDKSATTGGFV